jgi:hypothetical protein
MNRQRAANMAAPLLLKNVNPFVITDKLFAASKCWWNTVLPVALTGKKFNT